MSGVDRAAIAATLEEISILMALRGDNEFKIRSYQNAARALEILDLDTAIADGSLADQKGIGSSLATQIQALARNEPLPLLEELRASVPMSLLPLLSISGLGVKRLARLYRELQVTDADTLRQACESGAVAALKGFGVKTASLFLERLDYLQKNAHFRLLPDAHAVAQELVARLASRLPGVVFEICGSLRRLKDVVGDIDLLAITDDIATVSQGFLAVMEEIDATITRNQPDRILARLQGGIEIELRFASPAVRPVALVSMTGSSGHRTALRQRASSMGLELSDRALLRNGTPIPLQDEAAFYQELGLPWIPPELREDTGEIAAAENGTLPSRLLETEDLRGFLHVHTTYSDGRGTLEEMAQGVAARGGEYFGVCDHSQASTWAGGLRPERVREQHAAIDAWNAAGKKPFILKGIEADILPDGRIDYGEEILSTFDFVVASVHINFRMTESEMTERICRALENPYVDILGHPTGRLLLSRPAYPVNIRAVLEAAKAHDVTVEINANPHRLDLAWDQVQVARQMGMRFSVNTDAHTVEGLDNARWGVAVARRGWLGPQDVLNALPLAELQQVFRRKRSRIS